MDDINVAATQYFPFEFLGFTELLRSCNAIPGDRSYFVARLPEGEIGGILGEVGNFLDGLLGPDAGPIELSEETIDALEILGKCFNEADPSVEFAYEDALAAYTAIEAGVDGAGAADFAAQLPPAVAACFESELGTNGAVLAGGLVESALGQLPQVGGEDFQIVLLIAVSFFFAGGGEAENLTTSLTGIINEILGDDLVDALFNLELGGGLFPVRRGGEPIDQCLGYCFMQGVQGGGVPPGPPGPFPI